jgi:hypothetical protein
MVAGVEGYREAVTMRRHRKLSRSEFHWARSQMQASCYRLASIARPPLRVERDEWLYVETDVRLNLKPLSKLLSVR